MVAPSAPGARYLDPQDRVIGVVFNNDALAFPLKGLLWHEIINLNSPGRRMAVTYCPLTGSTLAFDRSVVQGAELGVSGLLYRNNLIMYDRNSQESLWSQMKREGIKGPKKNTSLPMTPIVEMTWEGWQKLHPDTKVMSSITGCPPEMWEAPPNEVNCPRNYTENPYGENYGTPNNDRLLYPMPTPIDDRRPPKERVLGIPSGALGGVALPFGSLQKTGGKQVVRTSANGAPVLVLWDPEKRAAAAYRPILAGDTLTFRVEDNAFYDHGTGSQWRIDGRSVSGPHAGQQLEPIATAYIAYWFAWAAFHPSTRIWTLPSSD